MKPKFGHWLACLMLCVTVFTAKALNPIGIFDGQGDIGPVKHAGSGVYDNAAQQYKLTGSCTNVWATHDEFHYIWKKMKGDFIQRTNFDFLGKGVEEHRKVGWMVRSSLDTNSMHVSAVVHGNGLTSLQFRRKVSGVTEEKKFTLTGADIVQLERKDCQYIMSVAHKGETFVSEKLDSVEMGDDVYVGLFICSHNPDVVEEAQFNNVRIVIPAPKTLVPYRDYLGSAIEILDLETQNSKIIYQIPKSLQAPNKTQDSKTQKNNQDGNQNKKNLATNTPTAINTGVANKNNNDHVISFDGKMLAVSSGNGAHGASVGFTVPVGGGEAKLFFLFGFFFL